MVSLVPWWRHQMDSFSCYCPLVRGIHRSPVNSLHKGQWREALRISLICAGTNSWVNNHEAGDLRCYPAHYDVTLMHWKLSCSQWNWNVVMLTTLQSLAELDVVIMTTSSATSDYKVIKVTAFLLRWYFRRNIHTIPGIIMGMGSANERLPSDITLSLIGIGRALTQYDPFLWFSASRLTHILQDCTVFIS